MRTNVKIFVYVGLIASGLLFGLGFREALILKSQNTTSSQVMGMGSSGAGCLGCLILLGVLLARDIATFLGNRTTDFVFNDDLVGMKSPEYEHAEEIWKGGDHLEAIRLMRAYYERYPTDIFVAMRIAEIYEKDLGNILAAVLEYEQILKQKLPTERWGWAAIHLVNLYGKMNQTTKGTELLERINKEFSQTAAARKARERLGIPEPLPPAPPPAPEPTVEAESEPEAAVESESEVEAPVPPPAPAGPKLPAGFRPKKK